MRILLLSFVLLLGCQSLDSKMESWVGASTDELVRSLGPPSQVLTLDSGHKLYVYASSRTLYVATPNLFFTPTFSCQLRYEANSHHRIISWSYQGACR